MAVAGTKDVMYAWDKGDGGNKVYGHHEDPAEIFRSLHDSNKYGYELIQKNKQCSLFADIEWMGPQDTTHERLTWIACKIREYCRHEFGIEVDLYFSCSSRVDKHGCFKNSYHLVCPTIVFDNNHDGTMRSWQN